MSVHEAAESTRIRRRRREDVARARLLEAAEIEFASSGFEDARMHAIADRARVALGTLYALVDGKHELYEAIHAQRLEELFSGIGDALAESTSSIDALERGIHGLVEFFVARPHYLAMHLRDGLAWSSAENMRTEVQRESWSRGFEMMRAMFAAAAADGFIEDGDPELHARLAIAMQQVFMARWLETEPRATAAALSESIWSTIERTLRRRVQRPTEDRT